MEVNNVPVMKILAEPSRYQGQMRIDTQRQRKKPRLIEMYFGRRDEMSLPAGSTFSNTHENMSE